MNSFINNYKTRIIKTNNYKKKLMNQRSKIELIYNYKRTNRKTSTKQVNYKNS